MHYKAFQQNLTISHYYYLAGKITSITNINIAHVCLCFCLSLSLSLPIFSLIRTKKKLYYLISILSSSSNLHSLLTKDTIKCLCLSSHSTNYLCYSTGCIMLTHLSFFLSFVFVLYVLEHQNFVCHISAVFCWPHVF